MQNIDRGGERGAHRGAASARFRADQWARRYEPHVEPINRLVDELTAQAGGRWMPYVAPYHGGIAARILLLFQDPGRMTSPDQGGSGFVGCENDDPSAELLAECLDRAGIDQAEVMPWNSYPWFIPAQTGVTVAMREQGLGPLHRVVQHLPDLQAVVAFGAVAQDTYARFARRYPASAAGKSVFKTFHTSGRGITNGGQQPKRVGVDHVIDTLRRAATAAR